MLIFEYFHLETLNSNSLGKIFFCHLFTFKASLFGNTDLLSMQTRGNVRPLRTGRKPSARDCGQSGQICPMDSRPHLRWSLRRTLRRRRWQQMGRRSSRKKRRRPQRRSRRPRRSLATVVTASLTKYPLFASMFAKKRKVSRT